MVAATTSSADSGLGTRALPPLPDLDQAILSRLFESDLPSLKDLFLSLGASAIEGAPKTLLALYEWSSRDDIRTWLEHHRAEESARLQRKQLARLDHIAETSSNPIEQRRASSTILRALGLGAQTRGTPTLRGGFRSNSPSLREGVGGWESQRTHTVRPSPATTNHPEPPSFRADRREPSVSSSPSHPNHTTECDPVSTSPHSPPSPLPTPHSPLPPPPLPISLSSTPALDAARLNFFAGGLGRVETPKTCPNPHPILSPLHVISMVTDALKDHSKPGQGHLVAFNHSGIVDRSLDSLETFASNLKSFFPLNFTDRRFTNKALDGDHDFTCTCTLTTSTQKQVPIRCRLRRPKDGPLALCWLLTMSPDTS